ncbi:MAG TPA: sigma-54 dependent transcriptional regulator [Thermoanaerobaculia bacterium]|nr:sigma-54 dependent transcriptional regulator [Thermoanaerobaculia bacterium]
MAHEPGLAARRESATAAARDRQHRLLVVEDRESLRRMLERALAGEGYRVDAVVDEASARAALAAQRYDAVLTDLMLPGGSGLAVVEACRTLVPPVPVVVMTAYGTVHTAVQAMKLGAADFLEKPVELDDLFAVVAALVGEDEAVSAPAAPSEAEPHAFVAGPGCPPIVGSHRRLQSALRLLRRVAPTESTVLLLGESGSGKELFARALHALSPRKGGPFVAINCAAIPESLLENELFGHERGAFTGAHRREPGRFERARGGTLLLDEIGELPLPVQGKVLRVLEERTYERVGSSEPQRADVRLVAATNRDVQAMVDAGELRSDLYFRLSVFPLELPPLRERSSDVVPLARHLLARVAERHSLAPPELTPAAGELLAAQPWPGNVRQLANVLERAAILHPGGRLGAGDVEEALSGAEQGDKRQVEEALEKTDGDKRRAAEELGISYRTLLRRVRQYDLEGFPRYRR